MQETRGKKQEIRSKRQETRGKRTTTSGLAICPLFFSRLSYFLLLTFCFLLSPAAGELDSAYFEKLIPYHKIKTPPGPYDWLAVHPEEGQSFTDFIESKPIVPDKDHRYIYIQKLGTFTQNQDEILQKTGKFIEVYYQLPVKFLTEKELTGLPPSARRVHPATGDRQVLSTYVIEQILIPAVPPDAFCVIAFTAEDLWPGEGWNFVFGQASLPDRVGVWSIYRNGELAKSPEEDKLFLRRTIATALHEIGHMFGMHHCIYYECLMNGSNYRQEADRRPLWLCPVCLRKMLWKRDIDLTVRFQQLEELSNEFGFPEGEFYKKAQIFLF